MSPSPGDHVQAGRFGGWFGGGRRENVHNLDLGKVRLAGEEMKVSSVSFCSEVTELTGCRNTLFEPKLQGRKTAGKSAHLFLLTGKASTYGSDQSHR